LPGQLQMLWPADQPAPPAVKLPPGYRLRQYVEADATSFLRVMHLAGFTHFDLARIRQTLRGVLPDGFFVTEHEPTGLVVATAMASHSPNELHPFGGELGWVAGDPEHAGKGLGRAVCVAVVQRFIQAGYKRIYLRTDDFRLPAVKIYLSMGFGPLMFDTDMPARWAAVCEKIGWKQIEDGR
jgi:mycothiol synthase